jgi:PHD/YefM family antitoxin component YafN of YafNO toxin-antitoxin module
VRVFEELTMHITTLSSRELNQDVTRAKRAASRGPVFITDRGKPAHVLLTFDQYQQMTRQRRNLLDALSMPGLEKIDFEAPKSSLRVNPADLS